MKTKDFVKGDRVAHAIHYVDGRYGDRNIVVGIRYTEYGEEPCYGAVTDILSNGDVVVNWDSSWKNSKGKIIAPSELMLEADAKNEYSRLGQEFALVQSQIKLKLEEAGKIIAEAHKLAQTTGNNLQEMYEVIRPLESAMDAAGWHTSSWGC
jgi:hypothetical protein